MITWYAIDLDGHLAAFDSGANGAYPAERNDRSKPDNDFALVAALQRLGGVVAKDEDEDDDAFGFESPLLRRLGWYLYAHDPQLDEICAGEYVRVFAPAVPLTRLAPRLLERLTPAPVRFAEVERCQPVGSWKGEWDAGAAYLAPDGVIRPSPNMREHYADTWNERFKALSLVRPVEPPHRR